MKMNTPGAIPAIFMGRQFSITFYSCNPSSFQTAVLFFRIKATLDMEDKGGLNIGILPY